MNLDLSLSNEQVHVIWSHEQLAAFKHLSEKARLEAVKTGALEHWTEADRNAAFDLIGGEITAVSTNPMSTALAFEAPLKPLSRQGPRSRWPAPLPTLAGAGWIAIVALVAAYIYGLFGKLPS
jgi:hypothetical protein